MWLLYLFGGCVISVSVRDNFYRIMSRGWTVNKIGFWSSSKKPNTQPKKKVIVTNFQFVAPNISYLFDMMITASLKDTQRQLYVTCNGFSNIEEFLWSCNFGCFWCVFFNVHTKTFVLPSGIFLVLSSICLHHRKSCVKQQWAME